SKRPKESIGCQIRTYKYCGYNLHEVFTLWGNIGSWLPGQLHLHLKCRAELQENECLSRPQGKCSSARSLWGESASRVQRHCSRIAVLGCSDREANHKHQSHQRYRMGILDLCVRLASARRDTYS